MNLYLKVSKCFPNANLLLVTQPGLLAASGHFLGYVNSRPEMNSISKIVCLIYAIFNCVCFSGPPGTYIYIYIYS
jgi:hypothetical protein